jgi:glutathione peroxidase
MTNALVAVLLVLASAPSFQPAPAPAPASDQAGASEVPPVLRFTVLSITGEPVDLARHAGKVLLVVNTASRCGYTPQYEGLQALHEKYAGQGLAVLGFPSNDFGGQEPGSNAEVQQFCQARFGVTFDLFAKGPVSGEARQPLYAWLTAQEAGGESGEVKWNFEKFLVGRDGQVIARYRSKTAPDAPELVQAIEAALARR